MNATSCYARMHINVQLRVCSKIVRRVNACSLSTVCRQSGTSIGAVPPCLRLISDKTTARLLSGSVNKTRGQSEVHRCSSSATEFSAKSEKMEVFRLSDYDCVGFDLDNTLLRYKLLSMIKLEYDVLANYLVIEKGYNPEYLLKPLGSSVDFIQKGLLLDFFRGNVLKLRHDGYIARASHGTRFMDDKDIISCYGPERKWEVSTEFCKNMLVAWNGPLSERMRTVLDYFDMPSVLVFARIIDSLDATSQNVSSYDIWPDILDGLCYMYQRENFSADIGGYFPAVKTNPEQYINKCSPAVLKWLKEIKKTKTTFLITGSNVDFASFTASQSMGENWKDFFDIVVCFARKPGFFTGGRPFVKLDGMVETDPIDGSDLEFGNVYSQGNWQELLQLIQRETKLSNPKCLYVGDNLIQDIYTPSEYTKCDTVAIVEELAAEAMLTHSRELYPDYPVLISNCWGSYFSTNTSDKQGGLTVWGNVIRKHSLVCVPSVEVLASQPLDFGIKSFTSDDYPDEVGYFPAFPLSLAHSKGNA